MKLRHYKVYKYENGKYTYIGKASYTPNHTITPNKVYHYEEYYPFSDILLETLKSKTIINVIIDISIGVITAIIVYLIIGKC